MFYFHGIFGTFYMASFPFVLVTIKKIIKTARLDFKYCRVHVAVYTSVEIIIHHCSLIVQA